MIVEAIVPRTRPSVRVTKHKQKRVARSRLIRSCALAKEKTITVIVNPIVKNSHPSVRVTKHKHKRVADYKNEGSEKNIRTLFEGVVLVTKKII